MYVCEWDVKSMKKVDKKTLNDQYNTDWNVIRKKYYQNNNNYITKLLERKIIHSKQIQLKDKTFCLLVIDLFFYLRGGMVVFGMTYIFRLVMP